jgi:hypothetical protein
VLWMYFSPDFPSYAWDPSSLRSSG